MKTIRKILLVAFISLTTLGATAQEGPRRQMQPREFNPEEFAARQTNMLHQALQLDSIQFQAIMLMNYADALTMQDSMKARRERFEKMQAKGEKPQWQRPSEEEWKARMELEKQRQEIKNQQMKQILNAEQYEKYIKIQEENRTRMRNMGRRPGGELRGGRMPRQ